MEKCNYYIKNAWSDIEGNCMGTKEKELCFCQGDKSKCDFYAEKMNTLDMMIKAKETEKTYRANDMLYNTKLGFHDKSGNEWYIDSFDYLNDLFVVDNWQEDDTIYITKLEAEKKYGIKIVG